MPKYDMPIPTRTEWQQTRDGAKPKVPKGAAKVSIGDSIEKAHKSFGPNTIAANIKDTQKLVDNLDAYMKQTATKYPAFQEAVKKVRKTAKGHLDTMTSIQQAHTAYPARYAKMIEVYKTVKSGAKSPEKLASEIEQVRGCIAAFAMLDPKWMAEQQKVLQWHKYCQTAADLTEGDQTKIEAVFNDIKV